MHTTFTRLSFALVTLVLGCGGSKSKSDAGVVDASSTADGSAAALAACTSQSNAACTLRDTCSPSFGIARLYGTIAICEQRLTQACDNALAANGNANTPALVDACAAAYPSEACVDFFDANPVAACAPKVGALANGTACGNASQCASTFCAIDEYAICGTCATPPAAGATCQVQADCGRDLACAIPTAAANDGSVSTSGTCAAYVASAGSCLTGYHPCVAGQVCVGEDVTTMTNGTCQAEGNMVGAACDSVHKTMPSCDANLGLVCIPTAKGSNVGTCQVITLVTAGMPCGNIGSGPITGFAECQGGGLCKKALTTDTMGTCVAPAADGAACDNDPANGPPCLNPAKCVPTTSTGTAGTCLAPNAPTCK